MSMIDTHGLSMTAAFSIYTVNWSSTNYFGEIQDHFLGEEQGKVFKRG